MQSKFFWKNWPSPYKQLYLVLLFVITLSILWFCYNFLGGVESVIGWDILGKTDRVNIIIDTFSTGPFNLTTSADNILFFQQFSGSAPDTNVLSYYIFLLVAVLSINILVAVISALPRFWYFTGMAIFAFVLVNYKLELLLLFGSEQKWGLIIALLLYLPASYFFNAVRQEVPFLKRLLTFLSITVIMALLVAFFAEVETPFLYLATYGMSNALVISLIFILMIAHEIIASFIYLLTSSGSTSGRNTLLHFYLITAIYLTNLVLAYLYETNVINWNIIYVNLFLLLLISALLGLWGFRQREEQYKYLFNFFPLGAIAYVTLAICCFTTIAHFFGTFNDPGIEVFRDFIIYAHLGYGIIFVVYITSNFLDPLKRSMPVYKVLYKPTAMPYFTFRLAGLIAFTAFLVKSNWEVPVNQSISAYYNGIADMHYHNKELRLAETYYHEAAVFGYRNHKSHYMLGLLAAQRKDPVKAAVYYKTAIAKNPSPQGYVNLSNLYLEQSRFFDALFVLNEGLENTPKNGHILNNLGLAYAKTNILDTAAYYLNEAFENKVTQYTASSNILALLAKHDLRLNADSIINAFDVREDPISLNNSFVLKNRAHEYLNKEFTPEDSVLSFLDASILYNQAFNHLFEGDSINTGKISQFIDVSANLNHKESLQLALCLNRYDDQDVNRAFRQLNWLANTSVANGGKYFNLIGLWALQQKAPDVAVEYFTWAADRNFKEAKLHLAITLTENRSLEMARAAWEELLTVGDSKVKAMAHTILKILNTQPTDYPAFNDSDKYLYLRYFIDHTDTLKFNKLVSEIKSSNYKAQAIFDMSQKLWKNDQTEPAIDYYTRLSGLEITDQQLFDDIHWYELKMLAARGTVRGLSTKINQGIAFDENRIIEKHYYTALINEASGDTVNARQNYSFIAYKNPFFEEAVIAAANFLGINDRFEAYNILLSAIEINPRSIKLLKAYILQCARVQLNSYARHSLEELQVLVSDNSYNQFVKEYEELVKKVEEAEQNF
ncbi:TPR repeat protein [Fulvivirga imtechensis AK7]|uniref:TPR repeat protein n=1 Tax=Fulvivirga imtechensis AK7 TaxID=1237149 RepID=L8JS62_9BACT|nr:tetratricopeptide repeat protein [Fulvivirga imtechensis]ELR70314.1 TPR repeat protein [Fulvivirga imtechensis AK7]